MSEAATQAAVELPVNWKVPIGGVEVTMSVAWEDVPTVLAWSTSEVILYLGSSGPDLQHALRSLVDAEVGE